MEQTPWEALKSFLREYDHKDGNYTEVTFNYEETSLSPASSITLRNLFGDIIILEGNPFIDISIEKGIMKENARLFIKFLRDEKSIYFVSTTPVMSGPDEKAQKSFFDLEITYREGIFKLFSTLGGRFTYIASKVTSIEYNREVHDVIPEDSQDGGGNPEGKDDPDSDPNPSSDLKRVVVQEGSVCKMNKN